MKRIPLTQGHYAIVDDEDYEIISQYKWCIENSNSRQYAFRKYKRTQTIKMHHCIVGYPICNLEIDHINGDGLDNRKENLRFCTHQENCRNRQPNKIGHSVYKGVSWFKGKWVATIYTGKDHQYIGRFKAATDAAKAYDKKAKELFGEFAYLNFP